MLQTEKLNELFCLLEKMTQSMIRAVPIRLQRAEKYFKSGILITGFALLALILGLVIWKQCLAQKYCVENDLELYFSLLIICLILLLVSIFGYAVTNTAIERQLRKQYSSSPMLTAVKNDLYDDAKFITEELWTFDKATLAYGLLQYRHRWSSQEGRAAVLAGDLRKLGLFPAWVALSISAAALKEDSNLILWLPIIAAAVFHTLAVVAFVSSERPRQVILVLEYAIQHADKSNTTPSTLIHLE